MGSREIMLRFYICAILLIFSQGSASIFLNQFSSYSFRIQNFSFSNSLSIEVQNVSVFGTNIAKESTTVCSNLPKHADVPSCWLSISQDLRIQRIFYLHVLYANSFKLQLNSFENMMALRKRDHEALAILRQFDSWDNEKNDMSKSVCMIGSDPRLHILLTFLSISTVKSIFYFIENPILSSENEWGLNTEDLATVLHIFPGKTISIIEMDKLLLQPSNFDYYCNVIILPSDKEAINHNNLRTVLKKLSNDKQNEVTALSEKRKILWITDTYHDGIYSRHSHCDDPSNSIHLVCKYFKWYMQNTWVPNAVAVPVGVDAEGYPRSYYFESPQNSNFHSQSFATTLYIGYDKFQSETSQQWSQNPAEENILILLTYEDRVYAETAKGLQQQLRQELGYPHVMVIPYLTLEILEMVDDYVVEVSREQAKAQEKIRPPQCRYKGQTEPQRCDRQLSTMHVVQVILTPHYPASRLVSSLQYEVEIETEEGKEGVEGKGEVLKRHVKYSYVMVHMEQTWFYDGFHGHFPAGTSLFHDALSIWTFSSVLQQAFASLYFQQYEAELTWTQTILSSTNNSHPILPQLHRNMLNTSYLDIVPVFAPCLPHMPCHDDFSPPKFPVSSQYELIFLGHCSPFRNMFLQELHAKLAESSPTILFNPPCIQQEDNSNSPVRMSLVGVRRDHIMLQRPSIILNIHQQSPETTVLEMHRLMYLLSMGKCVISQRGRDVGLSSLSVWQGAVYFVDSVEDVLQTLRYLFTATDADSDVDEKENEDENEDKEQQEVEGQVWSWLRESHGQYGRLARCERNSLRAFRLLHRLQYEATGEVDKELYGTAFLMKAMRRLQQRLVDGDSQ